MVKVIMDGVNGGKGERIILLCSLKKHISLLEFGNI
jgi:hypothetical protein